MVESICGERSCYYYMLVRGTFPSVYFISFCPIFTTLAFGIKNKYVLFNYTYYFQKNVPEPAHLTELNKALFFHVDRGLFWTGLCVSQLPITVKTHLVDLRGGKGYFGSRFWLLGLWCVAMCGEYVWEQSCSPHGSQEGEKRGGKERSGRGRELTIYLYWQTSATYWPPAAPSDCELRGKPSTHKLWGDI